MVEVLVIIAVVVGVFSLPMFLYDDNGNVRNSGGGGRGGRGGRRYDD